MCYSCCLIRCKDNADPLPYSFSVNLKIVKSQVIFMSEKFSPPEGGFVV